MSDTYVSSKESTLDIFGVSLILLLLSEVSISFGCDSMKHNLRRVEGETGEISRWASIKTALKEAKQ